MPGYRHGLCRTTTTRSNLFGFCSLEPRDGEWRKVRTSVALPQPVTGDRIPCLRIESDFQVAGPGPCETRRVFQTSPFDTPCCCQREPRPAHKLEGRGQSIRVWLDSLYQAKASWESRIPPQEECARLCPPIFHGASSLSARGATLARQVRRRR